MNRVTPAIVSLSALATISVCCGSVEQRREVSFHKGHYVNAFFWRHRAAFRIGGALHVAHSKQHDVLLLTALAESARVDAAFDREMVGVLRSPPCTEPSQEIHAPYTARAMWRLFRTIDWAHELHERTYDVMSDRSIPWPEKKPYTDRIVDYYLRRNDVGLSPAPLEVTMRRAAVMMKPYFTVFRNAYPRSTDFFFAAHWWHPAIYEALLLAGNRDQERLLGEVDATFSKAISRRPQRMLLSREMMPRYTRMSPEASNAFDNLHMLHGIAYDILAYEGWSLCEKRREIYRVIDALAYRPGDEALARKLSIPRPESDPRLYDEWLRAPRGEMSRIMHEMLEEMMPLMGAHAMTAAQHQRLAAQLELKLTPGLQEGELPGSLADALAVLMPGMQMPAASTAPGETPREMVEAMLRGWKRRRASAVDVEPWPMERDPAGDIAGGRPR